MKLTYPRDIFGHKVEAFDQRPSINWTGADVFFAQVAGVRLYMGGSSSYLTHADAIGTTTMVTDQTGAVDGDSTRYPWGQLFQFSGSYYTTFADLDFQINEPVLPSATRGYDAGLGRWLTPDPGGVKVVKLTNPQTWNMYAYVTDNPTSSSDPSGEACAFGVTIFGSYFGGSCAGDTPPPPLPTRLPSPLFGYLHTSIHGNSTTFVWSTPNGGEHSDTIVTHVKVDSRYKRSHPGAGGPYKTANIVGVSDRHGSSKAYGPLGAFIDTGDPLGRDIHGGGSRLAYPLAPHQGWCVTYGCTRGQNVDVQRMGRDIMQFKKLYPTIPIPYSRSEY